MENKKNNLANELTKTIDMMLKDWKDFMVELYGNTTENDGKE